MASPAPTKSIRFHRLRVRPPTFRYKCSAVCSLWNSVSADGISGNNEGYVIHLTPQFQFPDIARISNKVRRCAVGEIPFLRYAESYRTLESVLRISSQCRRPLVVFVGFCAYQQLGSQVLEHIFLLCVLARPRCGHCCQVLAGHQLYRPAV